MDNNYNKIIKFWFSEKTKKIWLYKHKYIYDNVTETDIFYIINNLNKYFNQIDSLTNQWLEHPKGALALLILVTEYPYYAIIKNTNVNGNINNMNSKLSTKIIKFILKNKFYKTYNKIEKQIFYTNHLDFSFFPTKGIVKRDRNYFYIKLSNDWYENAHILVNWVARNHKISNNIITNFIQKKGPNHKFGFIVPLAPIGPHITVNPKTATENEIVQFKIKKIYTTTSYNPTQLAAFCPIDSKYYILQWFLLEVSIPSKLKPKYGLPHITLASYIAIHN